MVVFGIILIAVVFGVVFKVLISEAKPYEKPLKTENTMGEKVIPKEQKKAETQKSKPAANKKNSKYESKTYRVPGGYGYLLGGAGAIGGGGISRSFDDDDDSQYRAYREELAAYDDFVASLDMNDD